MIRWLVASALLAGCSPSESPDAPLLADVEAGVRALDRAIGFSTAFIGSGVVDPRAPEDVIAAAIYQRFKAETGTCAQATPSGAVVSVDLGGGCKLASGDFVAGGTATVTVMKDARGGLTLRFDLALTVDRGQALAGSLSALTVPSGFGYSADLTLGGVLVAVPDLQSGVAGGAAALRGSGRLVGRTAWDLTLAGAREQFAYCYPDGGTLDVVAGERRVNVAYDDATRESGRVRLTEGGATRSGTLPARAGCPPTANPG